MLYRRRTWFGLFLAMLGVVLARLVSITMSSREQASITYVAGVLLALGGLALVMSAIRVTSVHVIVCPRCHIANPLENERCARCGASLPGDDGQGDDVT